MHVIDVLTGSGAQTPSRAMRLARPLLAAGAAAAAVAFVGLVDPNEPGHYPTCPFLALTGWYCPGCGSLRATHALVHGDLGAAFQLNPLLVLATPAIVVAWALWLRREVRDRARERVLPAAWIWALLVVVLAFGVLRNLPAGAWLAP